MYDNPIINTIRYLLCWENLTLTSMLETCISHSKLFNTTDLKELLSSHDTMRLLLQTAAHSSCTVLHNLLKYQWAVQYCWLLQDCQVTSALEWYSVLDSTPLSVLTS